MYDQPSILIVDDDKEIRDLLARYLEGENFRVHLAKDHGGLIWALENKLPDLIVLDVMLPDGSGLDICRELRTRGSQIPVILLTALKEDVDRIIGLEIGADDYMSKPFNPRELVARIRSLFRRRSMPADPTRRVAAYQFLGLTLEPALRRVTMSKGAELELSGAEFNLLLAFLRHAGRLLTRDQLLELTQGREAAPFERSIDILISRLRQKLSPHSGSEMIKTIRNRGYFFAAAVEAVEG
ncbi:response regulator transcription factor [Bosea sp. LjRoot9]|uniref:response regulator n=1 Tax=Bosea sp. LjRoot9 TaxID=3342341 RepID=UPI003ECCA985